jgi:hypothetical protein
VSDRLVLARDLPKPRARPGRVRPGQRLPAALRFRLARWNDHELILFDDESRESWLLYPPRSRYQARRRVLGQALLVERRPWNPDVSPDEHVVTPAEGCARHGLACGAQEAIQAAVDAGYDPFR